MDLIITTIYRPTTAIEHEASKLAEILDAPVIARGNSSLAAIRAEYKVGHVLVVTKTGPVVNTPGGEYFFHLNMAQLRINNLINGKPDHMVTAMGLTPGMTVLDCTLGLATDAIVASFVTGETGTVLGLEASPIIAAITGLGLRQFCADNSEISAALRRIKVKHADYNYLLPTLPDKCFDVVFFDPMFRAPIRNSSNLKPLRFLADNRPISLRAVKEACRIANKRVVVKEGNSSPEFTRLGISAVFGGKYSSVHYGVIETGGQRQ
jgi:16S rRNA (guanine1516-N2)-methyltransferase